MLLSHDVAWLRRKLRAKLAAPGPVFKCFSRPCRLLNRRDVLPTLIIARTVAMVHRIEVSCLSWNWRERSSVKITERAHAKRAKALHWGRESCHPKAALAG